MIPSTSRLSTIGLSKPIVLKFSISFNEVTFINIIGVNLLDILDIPSNLLDLG